MESLDNLTDKTKLFLLEMDAREKELAEKRQLLADEKATLDSLLERNRQLTAMIDELESRRSRFDDKVTTLIDALGEVPLREIS